MKKLLFQLLACSVRSATSFAPLLCIAFTSFNSEATKVHADESWHRPMHNNNSIGETFGEKPKKCSMGINFNFFTSRHKQQPKFVVKRSLRVVYVTKWFSPNQMSTKSNFRKLSNKMLHRNLYRRRKSLRSWGRPKKDDWWVWVPMSDDFTKISPFIFK